MSILFIFLDGVGLAPSGPDNPLTDAPTPFLCRLLGGPLVLETAQSWQPQPQVLFKPIDATLGVPGLPQSGTGQTALLAGVNAAALHGRHQPHVPPVALRPLLAEQNILRQVIERGGQATFANVFTPGYWEALAARRIRRSASVIAAEGAGVRFRMLDDLLHGEALAWDVTGAFLRHSEPQLMPITPAEAGAALSRIGLTNDLVFYENFLPDLAGHGRASISIGAAFGLIDGMLEATVATMRPTDTLVLSSDHGNIESIAAPTHTRNPVPLLVVGAQVAQFANITDISQIAGAILAAVGV